MAPPTGTPFLRGCDGPGDRLGRYVFGFGGSGRPERTRTRVNVIQESHRLYKRRIPIANSESKGKDDTRRAGVEGPGPQLDPSLERDLAAHQGPRLPVRGRPGGARGGRRAAGRR